MPKQLDFDQIVGGSKDEQLLREIRDNFDYFTEKWRPIKSEGQTDMRYVGGDPWDPNERTMREKYDRPVMTWDELSPYINQLVNDPRQNKRAIKINPRGNGATPATAQLREDKIREIQYNSRAQTAFTTAFQGAVERSYGYFGIGSRYVATGLTNEQFDELAKESPEKLYEQELYIYRIPNPDSVLFNPNYKEQDMSDSPECFVEERLGRREFKRRWPKAKHLDWQGEIDQLSSGWNTEKEVRVCAYFKIIAKLRKLYILNSKENKHDMVALYQDEIAADDKAFDKWMADEKNRQRIRRDRTIETRTVKQWMTNGLEILQECDPIPIPWIPIIPILGKELWVDKGDGPKRQLMSLVRLARDPFMAYCYIRSQEAEEAGMAPKAPVMGYVGQFETDREAWEQLNKIPRSFIQVDPVTDPTNENQLLPLPTRQPFVPNFQSYEIFAEAARRAIRTACGGSDLPTAAQRVNEKSGVALKEIEADEDRGTFHFIDNFNVSFEHAGRVIEAWFPFVYDTKREISIMKADGEIKLITINDEQFMEKDATGQAVQQHYDAVTGDHGITVSVGKDAASLRDEVKDLLQNIVGELQAIAAITPPGAAAKILALSIRLQSYGPLGDEIADTLDPPADQQAQASKMAQLQQTAQMAQEAVMKLQEENQKLKLERAGKIIDNQYEMAMQKLNNDIKVLIAEIQAKSQDASERIQMYKEFWLENHGSAHEAGMQAADHAHEHSIADKNAAIAAAGQASDHAHEGAMADKNAQIASAQSAQDATQAAAQPQETEQ